MFELNRNYETVYFFDDMIGTYTYALAHPMKPLRVQLTDQIVRQFDLHQNMFNMDLGFVQKMKLNATRDTLTNFHSDQYINVLQNVTPENKSNYELEMRRFSINGDCPLMNNLYDYVLSYTSGSVACAAFLGKQQNYQYAINWSGGLHHAKQSEASGFCYVNDCVLAILELLKSFNRVLYIDIDVHHGDGVQEAFYLTDRVMTCSFHKYKNFFPGTGSLDDIGMGKGYNYAVNYPLNQGLDDHSFEIIFSSVISKIMEVFRPDAIVLQGGADSLSGDRLGVFNLSIKGHAFAAQFLKKFDKPILFLGGGGYTLRNVPRCWAYETSTILGLKIGDEIPQHEYSSYYHPFNNFQMSKSNMQNSNKAEDLEKTTLKIIQNLSRLHTPGGVQIRVNQDVSEQVSISELASERNDSWSQSNMDSNSDLFNPYYS